MTGSKEGPSLHAMIKSAARALSTPARSGTMVTIVDIRRVASELGLPVTLKGDRAWILEELMRTAVDYGKLPELVESLKKLVRTRARRLEELARSYPSGVELVEDYIEASRRLESMLDDLKEVYIRYESIRGDRQ